MALDPLFIRRGVTVPLSWLAVLGMMLVFGAIPRSAEAQATAAARSEPAGYRAAIDSALEEMQLGNFVEAREQFTRAHALFPNARTLRGLGISEFELKHYVIAADHLAASLASDVRRLEGGLRTDTETLLERANTYIGELRIAVTPKSANVVIDRSRKIAQLSAPVRLDVGDHLLEFSATGYATERREVTMRGGQTEAIDVQLASLSTAEAPRPSASPAGEPAHVDETPVYKRWWLWTIVGVVVAGAAVGTVIALRANKEPAEYKGVSSPNTPVGAGLQPLWKY